MLYKMVTCTFRSQGVQGHQEGDTHPVEDQDRREEDHPEGTGGVHHPDAGLPEGGHHHLVEGVEGLHLQGDDHQVLQREHHHGGMTVQAQ